MKSAQEALRNAPSSEGEHDPKVSRELEKIWEELKQSGHISPFEYFFLFLSYTATSIRRNAVGSFAAVFVTALAIFLSGSILLATKPLGELFFSADSLFPIKVYVQSEKKELVGAVVGKQQGVSDVKFVSGAEALSALEGRLGKDHPLFEGLPSDQSVLPDRYLVEVAEGVDKQDVFQNLQKALSQVEGVDRISMQSDLVRQVQKLTQLFSTVGRLFAVAACFGAVLLVVLTVQLRFLLRSREVGVMRLVGATNRFIVSPLYLEAVLSGVAAVVLSLFGISLLEDGLFAQVTQMFPELLHRPDAFRLSYLTKFALSVAALLVTLLGTWCSVRFLQQER